MIPGSTDDDGNPYIYGVLDWRANPVGVIILSFAVLLLVLPSTLGLVVAVAYIRDRIAFPQEGAGAVDTDHYTVP